MKMNKFILVVIISILTHGLGSQPSKSFELRYFSNDSKANGETDFKGETQVFDTDQRVEFLKHYADFSKQFFNEILEPQEKVEIFRDIGDFGRKEIWDTIISSKHRNQFWEQLNDRWDNEKVRNNTYDKKGKNTSSF